MCCLDCEELIKYSNFYNFDNKTNYPLEEIIIVKNDNSIIRQPLRYNAESKINNYKIPKIIIEDSDEDIIYDKKYNFKNKLKKILENKIIKAKKIELNNKKIVENLLKKNNNEVYFENIQQNNTNSLIRNRKNKIEIFKDDEWDIIE